MAIFPGPNAQHDKPRQAAKPWTKPWRLFLLTLTTFQLLFVQKQLVLVLINLGTFLPGIEYLSGVLETDRKARIVG